MNPWLAFTVYTKKYYEFCVWLKIVKNEYDKITILNDFQGIEIPLSLVSGTYDPKSNVIKFTANFVE